MDEETVEPSQLKPRYRKSSEPRRNFTSEEREILLDLVEKYLHIVENKSLDFDTSKEKDITWLKIGDLFNNSAGVTRRTNSQIKNCYRNMKKFAMRFIANNEKGRNHIDRRVIDLLKTSAQRQGLQRENGNNETEATNNAVIELMENQPSSSSSDDQDLSALQVFLGTSNERKQKWNSSNSSKVTQGNSTNKSPKRRVEDSGDGLLSDADSATLRMLHQKIQLTKEQRRREQAEHNLKVEQHELKMEVLQAKLDFYIRATEKLKSQKSFDIANI